MGDVLLMAGHLVVTLLWSPQKELFMLVELYLGDFTEMARHSAIMLYSHC